MDDEHETLSGKYDSVYAKNHIFWKYLERAKVKIKKKIYFTKKLIPKHILYVVYLHKTDENYLKNLPLACQKPLKRRVIILIDSVIKNKFVTLQFKY